MRPWITGALFQDDFAGVPELVTSVTRAWLFQPWNSAIADLSFRPRKDARKQDEKNEIEPPGASEAAVFQLPCYSLALSNWF